MEETIPEEPSELAMRVSRFLTDPNVEELRLTEEEANSLTPYERAVLSKTARKNGWEFEYSPSFGTTKAIRSGV
jgi:hypothetical protein